MLLTRKLFASACPIAILAAPLVLGVTPAFAQSTGSEQIETVIVTGTKTVASAGLSSFSPVAKQNSSINQEFIKTQTPGQTFFQNLNMLPGINFTNSDPYGTSGGNIRMHGQDGNHISVTLDGMPLNDTGNYAMYTNQMIDPELTERVTINQGTTDVDSPTAAVTGGSIAVRTVRPNEDFGVLGKVSGGTHAFQRYFARVDSGEIGPWGTRAFVGASY
ncbi:MAG TPA: TonB-dependent receptor plug domain-containing protein [Rhizomicrobium sp.]